MEKKEHQFAKLFELNNGAQVLVLIEPDDDDTTKVVQRTAIEGVSCEINPAFGDEDKAQAMFDGYGMAEAESFYASVVNMMTNPDQFFS